MTLKDAEKKKSAMDAWWVARKMTKQACLFVPRKKTAHVPFFFPPTYQAMSLGPFDDIT